ncbi:MAG: Na+/H+ antiporter NhaA [bacterium]|nr:Na+/H+ antiporter NhaA [bacterium]
MTTNLSNGPISHFKSFFENRVSSVLTPLEALIRKQATSGILLIAAFVIAMVLANSPWQQLSRDFFNRELGIHFGERRFTLSLVEWVSQGLMALFFLQVGLEIKREILGGKLRDPREILLITIAALGGIIGPALLYMLISPNEILSRGWGIPTATDTAFSLAILALLSGRVSIGMMVFFTALSIFDDVGAVFIISIFYAHSINAAALAGSGVTLAFLFLANRAGIRSGMTYGLLGLILWIMIYKSGIHATCAGLLLALAIPARPSISQNKFVRNIEKLLARFVQKDGESVEMIESASKHSITSAIEQNVSAVTTPLQMFESKLLVPITIIVLPLFALFNAGIELDPELFMQGLLSPLTWGIVGGLVIGKPLGILVFIYACLKLKIGRLPEGISRNEIIGIAIMSGIGFTMSIFFSFLSFPADPALVGIAKFGIIVSSLLAAGIGTAWILLKIPKKNQIQDVARI